MSGDLVAWLRAQVDADERVAKAATSGPWSAVESYPDAWVINGPTYNIASEGRDGDISSGDSAHIARHDPARVLAEVAAKRRIIDLHEGDHECSTYDHNGEVDSCTWVLSDCSTLRLLALPYADRPGYRASWSPEEANYG